MGIDPTNPVNDQVHGLGPTKPTAPVKRENEDVPQEHATRTDDGSGDRLSLSEASKKRAATEPARVQSTVRHAETIDLSEKEAAQLAQQASGQLSRTHASISNQAVQKAVDLFT